MGRILTVFAISVGLLGFAQSDASAAPPHAAVAGGRAESLCVTDGELGRQGGHDAHLRWKRGDGRRRVSHLPGRDDD